MKLFHKDRKIKSLMKREFLNEEKNISVGGCNKCSQC